MAASPNIPAGFTYLGQFVDHDLTFDKTAVMLGESVTPADLLQARSPSLDLDSLYGAGPDDPGSEKFYEADGIHLRIGKAEDPEGIGTMNGFDLPRGAGNTNKAKRRAIVPDPGTTRTSRSRRPTSRSSGSTTGSSTPSRRPYRMASASRRLAGSSRGTTSGCSAPTTCHASVRRAS